MNAACSPQDKPPIGFAERCDYLRAASRTPAATEVLVHALRHWMAAEQEATVAACGYQWKSLFLPDTSRVRMHVGGQRFYAAVVGDQLMFEGHPVSPRQMTLAIAGEGRNAWRDLWICMPGEKNWTPAARLRRALEKSASMAPASPIEAVTAATKSMSEAFKTMLILLEQANRPEERHSERRLPKHRRREDYMIDDFKAD
jgi:hypothetical protein